MPAYKVRLLRKVTQETHVVVDAGTPAESEKKARELPAGTLLWHDKASSEPVATVLHGLPRKTPIQCYNRALTTLEKAEEVLGSAESTMSEHLFARAVRDSLLAVCDGVTNLERMRRAAAEEAESLERTL
jgi:hypothetical protein